MRPPPSWSCTSLTSLSVSLAAKLPRYGTFGADGFFLSSPWVFVCWHASLAWRTCLFNAYLPLSIFSSRHWCHSTATLRYRLFLLSHKVLFLIVAWRLWGSKFKVFRLPQEHVNSQHVTNWDDFGPGLGCHWSMLIRYLSTCDDCWAQERSETKNAWCSRNYGTCIFTSWKLTPWMMDTTAPVTFMLWYVSSQNLLSKTWWENGQMISIPMGKSMQLAAGPWQHAWREGPS